MADDSPKVLRSPLLGERTPTWNTICKNGDPPPPRARPQSQVFTDHVPWQGENYPINGSHFLLLVCATRFNLAKPAVRAVLKGLDNMRHLQVKTMDETQIVTVPIDAWPCCDALLCLWPTKLPLDILQNFCTLRNPLELNSLKGLRDLMDRRTMREKCEEYGIPVPKFVCVSRVKSESDEMIEDADVDERRDSITVGDKRLNKPFVEKPADAEDHHVCVYYPVSAGGGSTRISKSGVTFDKSRSKIRKDGSYVYEEFVQSEGFVVHIYCSGTGYMHGEARMSEVANINAQPEKDESKPKTTPVCLSYEEKKIAAKVCLRFAQSAVRIDILRTQQGDQSRSLVYDIKVCGFKNRGKVYFKDVIRALVLELKRRPSKRARDIMMALPSQSFVSNERLLMSRGLTAGEYRAVEEDDDDDEDPFGCLAEDEYGEACASAPSNSMLNLALPTTTEDMPRRHSTRASASKLLCVIAVVRHGERTPKRKLKLKLPLMPDLQTGLLVGWLVGVEAKPEDVKLLTSETESKKFELRSKLQINRLREVCSKNPDLSCVADVLSATRDVHVKVEVEPGKPISIVLKWGGQLTPFGEEQALDFGSSFRRQVYPGEDTLRMHASLRHDVKVYASNEPRCKFTAGAFAKGLLHIDTPLPAIVTSFVREDDLGRLGDQQWEDSPEKIKAKTLTDEAFQSSEALLDSLAKVLPETLRGPRVRDGARKLERFPTLRDAVAHAAGGVDRILLALDEAVERQPNLQLYEGETLRLMQQRWQDLKKDLLQKGVARVSAIPHFDDHIHFDLHHNAAVMETVCPDFVRALKDVVEIVESITEVILLCEVGNSVASRGEIGAFFVAPLLRKLRFDLRIGAGAELGEEVHHKSKHGQLYEELKKGEAAIDDVVRTRLYFAHQAHLFSLLNVLRYASASELGVGLPHPRLPDEGRMGYLSSIVFKLRLVQTPAGGELYVDVEISAGDSPGCSPTQRGLVWCLPWEGVDDFLSEVLRQREGAAKDPPAESP